MRERLRRLGVRVTGPYRPAPGLHSAGLPAALSFGGTYGVLTAIGSRFGHETAPDVVVTNTLSSDVAFVGARSRIGTLTAPPVGETGIVTWSLGDMVNGGREVAEIEVTVLLRGKTSVTNTASATGRVADPNSANNSASITVSVNPGNGSK